MVSYRDVQHIVKDKYPRKTRKSRKGRGRRGTKRFYKGSRSRTHPGRLDFTTKRGNKYFDRGGHRYRYARGSVFARLPYTVKAMLGLKPRRGRKVRKTRRTRRGKRAGPL
jgi:hypothetical protein